MTPVWALALGAALGGALAACGNDHAAPMTSDAGSDDDPLAIRDTPPAGSLDELHQKVISQRCSGQPGLCHNGQFEPNLSTPALTYAYVVGRPALEKSDRLRVMPGSAAGSFLIDKLRNRNGVSTQMPLGADPLDEADIKKLEAWIDGGALRAPGATPLPVLDNPPHRPEVAIFNTGGTRLDGAGPIRVAAGTALVLRHSVADFETPDSAIPFAAVVVSVASVTSGGDATLIGLDVVLDAAASDPQIGRTSYDPAGPMSKGDQLDYVRSWTIPATVPLYNPNTRARISAAASGLTFSVFALYTDAPTGGMIAFDSASSQIAIP